LRQPIALLVVAASLLAFSAGGTTTQAAEQSATAPDTSTTSPQVHEESLTLTTEDAVKLQARLARPEGWQPRAGLAVLCHPHPQYGGTMDDPLIRAVGDALNAAGFATIRFNFRGTGRSGGEYAGGLKEPLDVLAAARYALNELQVGAGRLALVGYSFGAGMAAGALHQLPTPVAYAGIALPVPLKKPEEDWTGLYVAARPVLLVAGARDTLAPPAPLAELAAARSGNTRLEIIGGASHFFDAPAQRQAVAKAVVVFVRQVWNDGGH
ncbi:MAG: prolyl oligopeptidase family serine peptidase, partial [Armatimonadetes bacterium]|nr:prolyl oligopeptidase family serine peptidase [Armatimonadota bacterium]